MRRTFLVSAVMLITNMTVCTPLYASPDSGWQELFNGKNLDGWLQLNGSATYEAKDGVIVGTTVAKSKNSFLATTTNYGDFILEYEAKVDATLNSGVQFRSLSNAEYLNGRVHGYQLEMDTSARAWSGGIYDEARRKWLYTLSNNPQGRQAFKPQQWNKFRIEAIGTSMRTYVNGIATANLVDDETAEGFIALQVHSIGGDANKVGKQIRWRNLRIKTENLRDSLWPQGDQLTEQSYIANHITPHQKATGWKLLWDGKTSNGWRSVSSESFPEKGWVMQDGVLSILPANVLRIRRGGDIVTTAEYANFELELDFKFTKGANSGIKYLIKAPTNGRAIGLEYQLLDDKNHPDANRGKNGNRTLASLYDLISAGNVSLAGANKKRFNGLGSWNRARIIVNGGQVEHWLNGEKTLQYNRYSPEFKQLVANSKYSGKSAFGESAKGVILLQDHGDLVHFRSIKIRNLDAAMTSTNSVQTATK